MAIIIKELIIKGKVIKDLQGAEVRDGMIEDYLKKIKKEIIETCKEKVKEDLERERMK
jgi:hypothetical protein